MANRSYLYALDNRPQSYRDRPDTISGLSEWPYFVPFFYRLLLSGDTQRCASLISDGLDDDASDAPTPLYAVSGVALPAMGRVDRFLDMLVRAVGDTAPELIDAIADTRIHLAQYGNSHFLLETVELDLMTDEDPDALREMVDEEVRQCLAAGRVVDGLSQFHPAEAASALREAVRTGTGPLAPLKGLILTNDFDNTRDNKTDYPLGLSYWSDVLYFGLFDKKTFEEHEREDDNG